MSYKLGSVAVDSGLLLVIDPCYIFNKKEWDKICAEGLKDGGDIGNEILKMLMNRVKQKEMENGELALVFRTEYGDGLYKVERDGEGIKIEGA